MRRISERHPLCGRAVTWVSSCERKPGRRYGVVRRVTKRGLVVQLASDPAAASLSAQYRGERVRVQVDWVLGYFFRGQLRPLSDLLPKEASA